MEEISEFRGEYRFLSNFYPCKVRYGLVRWKSAEHAYQAQKTLIDDEKNRIRLCKTSGDAKKAGYRITLRPDWDAEKLQIMEEIVRAKFIQNANLGNRLLATGDAKLTEGNWWGDTFWGAMWKEGEWVGKNHLGRILMGIREELRPVKSTRICKACLEPIPDLTEFQVNCQACEERILGENMLED